MNDFIDLSGIIALIYSSSARRTVPLRNDANDLFGGGSHPDPDCKQLRVLQHIFGQLAKGEVDKIESHWFDQLVFKIKKVVTGGEWQKALPFMHIWWDFLSMPQPFAETAGTSPAYRNHLCAEGTAEVQCLQDGLANAVASIEDF